MTCRYYFNAAPYVRNGKLFRHRCLLKDRGEKACPFLPVYPTCNDVPHALKFCKADGSVD